MKLLLFALGCLLTLQTPADVTLEVKAQDFQSLPGGFGITLTPVITQNVYNDFLVFGASKTRTLDSSGFCYFSNTIPGVYRLDLNCLPPTNYFFGVTTNMLGVTNVVYLITNAVATVGPIFIVTNFSQLYLQISTNNL